MKVTNCKFVIYKTFFPSQIPSTIAVKLNASERLSFFDEFINNIENEYRSFCAVISFIASKGKMSKIETEKAVEKGLSVCKDSSIFSNVSDMLIPYNEGKPEDVLKALKTLSNSSFKKKEVFLNAFSETINFDKKVTTQEKELQVAIFESLGCPHPKV